MGREKDVIRVLEPEERKHPDDPAIAYMLGTALIRDKQVEKGQLLVDRILRNGDSAEAHLMLGSAKMNVADFAGARDEFAKAVALNPNLAEVHVLYAKALVLTGDSDQSSKEFKAELAVNQDRKSTRLNSSHRCISYAVFCLKKKKTMQSFSPISSRRRRSASTWPRSRTAPRTWCLPSFRSARTPSPSLVYISPASFSPSPAS